MLAHEEVRVNLVLRRNGEVQHGVLETVLGLSLRILVDGSGVTQSPVVIGIIGQGLSEVRLSFKVIVAVREPAPSCLVVTIAVRAHKRALDISKECRRRRGSLVVALRCSVVAEVTGLVSKRDVESHTQVAHKRDVGIEAHVQAVHIVVLQGTLCRCVAYRQVVVGHSVATLNVDAVVLRNGRMVDVIRPIGVLVILVVIVVVLILNEELELTVGRVGSLQHLRSIAAVLTCVHD